MMWRPKQDYSIQGWV